MSGNPRGTRKTATTGGFTLVEAAVATVLFVIGLVGLAQVAITSANVRRVDAEKAAASIAVSEQLQNVEMTPFSEIIATHDGRGFAVLLEGQANAFLRALPGDPDGLSGSIQVTIPDPPADPTNLLEVTVQVEWVASFGPRRISRTIRLSRVGARP